MTDKNKSNGPATMSKAEGIKKVAELIKDIKVAMLVTMEDDGSHRARPMWMLGHEFDGRVMFFTDIHSAKAYEVRKSPQVNLSFADPGSEAYVSISGTARMITDRAKIREQFTPMHKAWYPDGADDANLCMLEITADFAEYWDSPGGNISIMIAMAKALVTGKPHQHEETDNEKLNFSKN